MTSQYPNQLDTNVELPSVEDNITEIGGEAINGLRDAVFNIEETLGLNPQGSVTDVTTRLNVALNSNGTIKSSALAVAGLLTSPIVDANVATNAGISESKLSLDYSTTQLKTFIDQGLVRINNLSSGLADIISKVNRHVSHPATWGRHQTSDLDGYEGKYSTFNLQGIISDLDARLEDHVFGETATHAASAISADDSQFLYAADNVQTALNYLNNLGLITMVNHRDNDHDNGILSTQDVTLPSNNRSISIIEAFPLYDVVAGTDYVRFTAPPTGFGQISRDDILVITVNGKQYEYRVSKIDSSTNVVYFLGVLTESGASTAYVYRTTEELSSDSVLKAVILQESVFAVGGSIIKVINPNSPFVVSSGTRPWELSDTASQISLRWPFGEIPVTGLNLKTQMETNIGLEKSEWTVTNCVEVLNKMFVSYDMPVVAFDHNGEMGIVYDGVDGYVEVVGPSSNSAWGVLGFVEGDKIYGLGKRKFYIDGYEYYDFRLISESNGATDGSLIIKSIDKNLVSQGVVASGIAKITPDNVNYYNSSVTERTGSVVYTARAEDTLTMSSSLIGLLGIKDVGIQIYADTFSVPVAPSKRTLYELFLDGYSSPYAEVRGAPRVEYYNCQERRPDNPETWFDVIAVSRNFGYSQKRIYYNGNYGVMFGDRGDNGTLLNYGNIVSLPRSEAEGYQFRLYDNSNINYIDLEIVAPTYLQINVTNNTNAIDVDIYNKISEDRYLQIATVLHDRTKFSHLDDRRNFGTTGRKSISDDFKRDYLFYPTSLLRGNGPIMGLDVSEDTTTTDPSININGGLALVNGFISLVSKTNLSIPLDTVDSTFNVFVDSDGVLQILKDNTISGLINPSLSEIINSSDKLMLAQVDYVAGTQSISAIRDYRRFVGNIDGKMDLFVGHNENSEGSFSSLRAAVNYINALYPSNLVSKTIKIKGTNSFDLAGGPLYLPDGVSIVGDNFGNKNGDGYGAKIILTGTGTSFIVPGNNCGLEKVYIEGALGSTCSAIIGDANNLFSPTPTLTISGLKVIGCTFKNTTGDIVVFGKKIKDSIFRNNYIQVKATNYADYIYGVLPSNISGVFIAAEELSNVIIEENNCYCYGGGDILSFVYSYGSAENVWVSKNIVSASGLLGYGIDAIEMKNAVNVHIRENTLTFATALYEGVMGSGVINLNGNVLDCSINNNIITYKNLVSQGDFWTSATENMFSNFSSFAPGYIISVNSYFQLITTYSSTQNLEVTNVEINGNHISAMCISSAICVGIGNGIGNNVRVENNIIDDSSYLVLSGISINTIRTNGAYAVPVMNSIHVENNYVRNSIRMDYSDGLFSSISALFGISSGLISVGGLTSIYNYNGYFVDLHIENNSLVNDFEDEGMPNGIVVEKALNLFVSKNSIYNCNISYSASYSIFVNGANGCFIDSNMIIDCGTGIYVKNDTLGAVVFSVDTTIVNNSISSVYGGGVIVKVEGITGKLEIDRNVILNSHAKTGIIYVEDCTSDRYINANTLYSSGSYEVIQAIYITGSGGLQKTFINNNVIRVDGYLTLGSIGCVETGTIQDIYISRNSIIGEHRDSGIYALYGGANNSYSMSNVFIEGNIIKNTSINELTALGALIKGGTTNSNAFCFNFGIKNNFVIGNGSAIWADGIYGLDIVDNQLLGPVTHADHSAIDVVYGVLCNRCNYVDVSSNLVINYHYPISVIDSIDVVGVAGAMSVSDNIITNSTVNFSRSINIYDVNYSDATIMSNIIHCSIVDAAPSTARMISCEGMTLSRTFLCRNSLLSLKKLDYGMVVVSTDLTTNLVISDNNLLLEGVTIATGACIGVSVTGGATSLSNCLIADNLISGVNLYASGIYVASRVIADLNINSNRIYSAESTNVSNVADAMIKVVTLAASSNINISHNILENIVDLFGVANGIGYAGIATTGLNISGNILKNINYYNSTFCASINVVDYAGKDFAISGNVINDSSIGIGIYGNVTRGVISNNIVETSGLSALAMSGVDPDWSMRDIVITGNCFSNVEATTIFHLVSIATPTGQQILFNNNILNSRHSGGASGFRMLYIYANQGVSVTGNHFSNNGGDGSGYSVKPVYVYTADQSDACSLNNLRDVIYSFGVTAYTAKIECTGSNFYNFGENYYVPIPLSSFNNSTIWTLVDAGGVPNSNSVFTSSWIPSLAGVFIYSASNVTYTNFADKLHVCFGTDLVPKGATINFAHIYCAATGDEEGVNFYWGKRTSLFTPIIRADLTTVSPSTDLSGVGLNVLQELVPTVATKMGDDEEHIIEIKTENSGTYTIGIGGAAIHYTL